MEVNKQNRHLTVSLACVRVFIPVADSRTRLARAGITSRITLDMSSADPRATGASRLASLGKAVGAVTRLPRQSLHGLHHCN